MACSLRYDTRSTDVMTKNPKNSQIAACRTSASSRSAQQCSSGRSDLIRSSAHAFIASMVGVLLGFASSIVVSRALGPSNKGEYDLVVSTALLLALILGLSIPSGITFSVARRESAARVLTAWIVGIGALQAVATLVVLGILGRTGIAGEVGLAATDSGLRLVVSLLVGAMCIAACLKAVLVGLQRVPLASWMDVLGRGITLVMLAGVAVVGAFGGPTVSAFTGAMLAGAALGVICMGLVVVQLAPSGPRAGLGTVFRFSSLAYIANVAQYLNYRLDLFLVAYFRNLTEVGLYALAVTLTQLIMVVGGAVSTAVFSRVGSGVDMPAEAAERTAALSRGVVVIQSMLAVLLAVLAVPLLVLVYGSDFEAAASPIWLLLPGVVALGAGSVLAAHLAGLGRPDLNLLGSLASLAVTLPLDLLLIPPLGMNGAALASTGAYLCTTGVAGLFFARVTGLPLAAFLAVGPSDVRRLLALTRSVVR